MGQASPNINLKAWGIEEILWKITRLSQTKTNGDHVGTVILRKNAVFLCSQRTAIKSRR